MTISNLQIFSTVNPFPCGVKSPEHLTACDILAEALHKELIDEKQEIRSGIT